MDTIHQTRGTQVNPVSGKDCASFVSAAVYHLRNRTRVMRVLYARQSAATASLAASAAEFHRVRAAAPRTSKLEITGGHGYYTQSLLISLEAGIA
jgi:hypothetical protein